MVTLSRATERFTEGPNENLLMLLRPPNCSIISYEFHYSAMKFNINPLF